jgi:K+-sensing histidine kinase KdpD
MGNNQNGKTNILYVDDEQLNLTLFRASFEEDFNVFLAESGNRALELLEKEKFAVIISDQRMPGMLGTELLEITQEKYPEIIRFMLTAYTDSQTIMDSINMGKIYGFFNKPFKYDEVKMALDRAIEVYNLREGNARMMEEIEQANLQLRTIDKVRTHFLATITNEIRSPITKILSVVNVLKDNVASSDLAELVNYLDGSLSKLEKFSLITNQLARLTEDKVDLDAKEISLRELLETAIIESRNNPSFSDNKIVSGEIQSDAAVIGEFELLLTGLSLLLELAFSHSSKEDQIVISIHNKDEDQYILGITIPHSGFQEEELERIRSFFSSSGNAMRYEMGLELILVRQIIAIHKGSILFKGPVENNITLEIYLPAVVKQENN